LQALLAVMKQRGVTAVTMEVSSHALAMGRVNAVGFDIAGFTNLTQDHLDFHVDMEDYFATKSMLFTDAYARRGVVMVDDAFGQRLAGHAGVPVHTASAASSHADWWVEGRSSQPDGLQRFSVRGPGRTRLGLVSSLPGRFNVANSLLAAALVLETGASAKKVAAGLSELSEVPGRMERIALGQQFLVLVDYAHTPHAVESLMQAVRPDTSGRVLLVIGAGGDRDRAKRSLMGEIAAAGADVLIVTDDNPRSEDPATIRAAVLVGASGIAASDRAETIEIADRAEAISEAIRMARPGDAVIVAGKGHESGQDLGDVTVPFHDRAVVEDALRSVLS
jgi:UDP-N-acetylmuramoyl-L-alanyl-D-glutamate--2,6-diaminopimelate ligase